MAPGSWLIGTVWMAGYPNGVLYSYNPNERWNPWFTEPVLHPPPAPINPTHHRNFSAKKKNGTLIKYAHFLVYSRALNRLYCLGRRERDGFGTGLGWYDLGSMPDNFDGTDKDLETLNPAGLLVMDEVDKLTLG